MKAIILVIILLTPGCTASTLIKMAALCRSAGVKEVEVADGYMRVICNNGAIYRGRSYE